MVFGLGIKPIEWFTNRTVYACIVEVRPYLIPVKSNWGSLVEIRIQLPRVPHPSSDVSVWWYSRERLKLAVFGRAVR